MISLFNMSLHRSLNRNLQTATDRIGKALQRLGSGSAFNSPKDGAVTFSQLVGIKGQARGLQQALQNVGDAEGLTQQAETTLSSMLQDVFDLRQLAERAANSSTTSDERTAIQSEASRILNQLSAYSSTQYNRYNILDGSLGTVLVQNGNTAASQFSFSIGDVRTSNLGRLAIYSGAQTAGSTSSLSSSNALVLNGITIGGTLSDGVSNTFSDGSALAKVNAINSYSNQTGVYAETLGTIRSLAFSNSGSTFTGTLSGSDFKINGTSITGTISTASDLINSINAATSSTGVVASVDSSGYVQLTASDGRNIRVQISNSSGHNFWDATNLSANQPILSNWSTFSTSGADNTNVGAIRIYSSKQIVVSATSAATIGIASGVYNLSSGTSVTAIDLSTTDNAKQALKVLDTTVTQISALQANAGAVHNRLDSSASKLVRDIDNLNSTAETIGGADFALETANLVYGQLLQNSSLASLIQANVSAVTVAKLLGNS